MSAPAGASRSRFGINYGRRLSKEQQAAVRHKWLSASMPRNKLVPEPQLGEVCWSDDYKHISVRVESGVLECGFRGSLAKPAGKYGEHHLIFSVSNPGAASLLGAIEETLNDGAYAHSEGRRATDGSHC